MQPRFRKRLLTMSLCLALASSVSATTRSVVVEPARTRVGIAKVMLSMEPLVLTNDGLLGDYTLRVPLAPFMDDSGTVEIPLTAKLSEVIEPGATLLGTATSRENGRVHEIACTFKEAGRVRIVVTTKKRVLKFEAPYTLIQ